MFLFRILRSVVVRKTDSREAMSELEPWVLSAIEQFDREIEADRCRARFTSV